MGMELPVVSCEDCGACCTHIRTPPFVFCFVDGRPIPMDGDDEFEDGKTFLSAPTEAHHAFVDGLKDNRPEESPCSWWDQDTKRCRWYGHRPAICREYEVGGESCFGARSGERIIISRQSKALQEA